MCRCAAVVILMGTLALTGCIWPVHVPPPSEAEGTWVGSAKAVSLRSEEDGVVVTGIELTVVSGSNLDLRGNIRASVPIRGVRFVLIDRRKQVIPWRWSTTEARSVRVSGIWSSRNYLAYWRGHEVFDPSGPTNKLVALEVEEEDDAGASDE